MKTKNLTEKMSMAINVVLFVVIVGGGLFLILKG